MRSEVKCNEKVIHMIQNFQNANRDVTKLTWVTVYQFQLKKIEELLVFGYLFN